MRILVTGGAGFVGSQFVRGALADEYGDALAGAHVTVFDTLTYAGNLANLATVVDDPRYSFVHGDICSAAALDAALPGHDLVVNFAAESHVDRSLAAAEAFVRTNVVGAQQLFAACVRHDVAAVVHVSTDEVYGSIAAGSWREDHLLAPNSPYSATKASADLLARAYCVSYGLDVRVTRATNTYGPYQFPEKLVPRFVTTLLTGRPVPLYGAGEQVREWLHVTDHCRGVALVAERGTPGEVYNIGGGRALSNRAMTQLLLDATGRSWDFVEQITDPRGASHDARCSVDGSKLEALGYEAQVAFEDGLARTVEWYANNRAWWEPLLERAERS